MILKLMTYNIRHGLAYGNGIDISKIYDVIKSSDADIVALNEVRGSSIIPGYTAQANILAKSIGYYCFFGKASFTSFIAPYGNAILSKYPIESVFSERLPITLFRETRSVIDAVIRLPSGGVLRVLVTHLGLTGTERKRALAYILSRISSPVDTVLMGDLNMTPEDSLIKDICRILPDTASDKDILTFPSNKPVKKIDYILASSDISVRNSYAVASTVSDHRPLITIIGKL